MSDLQCPVTVVVMRHGESEGNVGRSLSSAAPGGALTDRGREQVERTARGLLGRRVAQVYASPLLRAQQSAQILARVLDAGPVRTLPGVRELGLGAHEGASSDAAWADVDAVFDAWLDGDLARALPQAESGSGVLQRFHEAFAQLADEHRGETVVVVSHGGAMSLALPRLARNVPADRARGAGVPNAATVELDGDSDGWTLRAWPEGGAQLGTAAHPGDLAELTRRAAAGLLAPADVEIAGVPCRRLAVPFAWGTQACLTALPGPPSAAVLSQVVDWLDEHGEHGWRLVVPQQWAAGLHGLPPGVVLQERLGVWWCQTPPDVGAGPAAGRLEPARDVAEFLQVYGAELAPVVQGHLGTPGHEFLVLRQDGEPVACARLRDVAGTTYVGGIQVLKALRGNGLGRTVSALAVRRALQRSPVAWLHCEDALGPLYASVGFHQVDTHCYLGPGSPRGAS